MQICPNAQNTHQEHQNPPRSLQQQVDDSAHQLAVALEEVQRLQQHPPGGAPPTKPPPTATSATTSASSSVQLATAQDVISHQLRTFHDVEELVQQNARLLQVSRQLAREAEATKLEAQTAVRQEYDVKLSQLAAELDATMQAKERQQGIMEQVVRQRDMYKKLYTEQQQKGGGGNGPVVCVWCGVGANRMCVGWRDDVFGTYVVCCTLHMYCTALHVYCTHYNHIPPPPPLGHI